MSKGVPAKVSPDAGAFCRSSDVSAQDSLPPQRSPAPVTVAGENPIARSSIRGMRSPTLLSISKQRMKGYRLL